MPVFISHRTEKHTFLRNSRIFSVSFAAYMCQRAPGFSFPSINRFIVSSSESPSWMVLRTSGARKKASIRPQSPDYRLSLISILSTLPSSWSHCPLGIPTYTITLAASDTSKWRFVVPYFLSSGVINPVNRKHLKFMKAATVSPTSWEISGHKI